MTPNNCIKAYIQKTLSINDIVDIIGFNLGVNKIYSLKDGKALNLDEEISEDNYGRLLSVNYANNCSVDTYIDSEGIFYIAMTDPASLFHGFKIQDEPFNPILKGSSNSVTFMNSDSLSLALAVSLVNVLGGTVTIDENKVHNCSNKNCMYPILSKMEMKEVFEENEVYSKMSNDRFYKLLNIFRLTKVVSTDFIEKLHNANPELDNSKESLKRIRDFTSYLEDDKEDKNKLTIKIGR